MICKLLDPGDRNGYTTTGLLFVEGTRKQQQRVTESITPAGRADKVISALERVPPLCDDRNVRLPTAMSRLCRLGQGLDAVAFLAGRPLPRPWTG